MAYQLRTAFPTIPLSGTVSDALVFKDTYQVAVWFPTITSGSVTVQGAYSTNAASADFLPIVNAPPNSGPFTLWVGPGSLAIALDLTLGSFPAIRFVTSVAQAAVRSLAAIYKV
jgi:hypothetical protein